MGEKKYTNRQLFLASIVITGIVLLFVGLLRPVSSQQAPGPLDAKPIEDSIGAVGTATAHVAVARTITPAVTPAVKAKAVAPRNATPEKTPVIKTTAVTFNEEPASGEKMATVSLNVRQSPSLTGKRIGSLTPNKKVVVSKKATADGIIWYKVTVGNLTGWASGNYLTTYKAPVAKKYAANTIYFGGKAVPYKNTGMAPSAAQRVIDNSKYAATFGGQAIFDGFANTSTHFVGHNGGRNQFGGMHTQSVFIVTDSQGNAFEYVKTARYVVDEYGKDVNTGVAKWDRITGSSGGNRIVMQSTKKHPQKWIVEATFSRQLK